MTITWVIETSDRANEYSDVAQDQRILVFDPRDFELMSVADQLRRLDAVHRDVDAIVVRGPPGTLSRLKGDRLLFDMLGDTTLWCLASPAPQAGPRLELVYPPDSPAHGMPSLDLLAELELRDSMVRNRAILSGQHYVLPSGAHANAFVRLALCLRDDQDVERLADWIVPHCSSKTAIVVDTGTILPLAQAIRRRFEIPSVGDTEASGVPVGVRLRAAWSIISGRKTKAESIPLIAARRYDETSTHTRRLIRSAAARLGPGSKVLYLISVNSTGHLIRQLRGWTPSDMATHVSVVALVDSQPLEGLWSIAQVRIERWPVVDDDGRCERCSRSVHRVSIDPETYERVPQLKHQRYSLSPTQERDNVSLWEAADRVNAIRFHYDVTHGDTAIQRVRHFAIHVAVDRLLSDEQFYGAALGKLRELEAPDVVLIPSTTAYAQLSRLSIDAFPSAEILRVSGGRIDGAALSRLSTEDTNILIVDAALVSGNQLLSLRKSINTIHTSSGRSGRVDVFVVLSRPSTSVDREKVNQSYRSPSHPGSRVHALYNVLLPATGRKSACSFCQEYYAIVERIGQLREPAYAAANARRAALEKNDVWPMFVPSAAPGGLEDKLHDSFLGAIGPKAAFASACSTAQALQDKLSTPPISDTQDCVSVIDIAKAANQYLDGVLLAAFLRTCEAKSIRSPDIDLDTDRQLRQLASQALPVGVVEELALAAHLGKLPVNPVIELLRCASVSEGTRLLFLSLLNYEAGLPESLPGVSSPLEHG